MMKHLFLLLLVSISAFGGDSGGFYPYSTGTGGGGGGSGTVTSAGVVTDSTTSSIFANTTNALPNSPITTAGNITLTLSNQAANLGLFGPSTGTAAVPAFRALVGADLPNPAASSLGGIQSAAAQSNKWIASISTTGVPSLTQPAFTNISGTVAAGQLPNPGASSLGGIESYAAVSNQWINTISTSGVPSSTQPAFSNLSGSITLAQFPESGTTGQVFMSNGTSSAVTINTVAGNTNIVKAPTTQVFSVATTSATYTLPTNPSPIYIKVRGVGGGGGSGGTQNTSSSVAAGGGGGGAGYFEKIITSPSATYTFTVGSAGSAGANNGSGGTGGSTIFSTMTANGGAGGGNGPAIGANNIGSGGGNGGTASGGDINIQGQAGFFGFSLAGPNGVSGYGGSSTLGAGGNGTGGAGGTFTQGLTAGNGGGAGGSYAGTSYASSGPGTIGGSAIIIVNEYYQ